MNPMPVITVYELAQLSNRADRVLNISCDRRLKISHDGLLLSLHPGGAGCYPTGIQRVVSHRNRHRIEREGQHRQPAPTTSRKEETMYGSS